MRELEIKKAVVLKSFLSKRKGKENNFLKLRKVFDGFLFQRLVQKADQPVSEHRKNRKRLFRRSETPSSPPRIRRVERLWFESDAGDRILQTASGEWTAVAGLGSVNYQPPTTTPGVRKTCRLNRHESGTCRIFPEISTRFVNMSIGSTGCWKRLGCQVLIKGHIQVEIFAAHLVGAENANLFQFFEVFRRGLTGGDSGIHQKFYFGVRM